MSADLGAKIAQWSYGKSDKVNSPQNQSNGFQRGYKDRVKAATGIETLELITAEWVRIGRPKHTPLEFKEYKRGLWAASFQTLFARQKAHGHDCGKEGV